METIGKEAIIYPLKFCLDDSLTDKRIVLEYISPNNDDDDIDFPYRELPINTPSPPSLTESY